MDESPRTSPDPNVLETMPSVAPPTAETDHIGPYRIVRILGQGGMGIVYEAEQLEPLRRSVALKVIKLGMDTRDILARFEAERQALAVMDHPNIAKALDAGTTEGGRPYFVMELVRGVPLTDYCDRQASSTRERLELFIAVCQGVQHAHQKGVIHRDLKPSNILVVEHDGRPVPKIIDFGIAKAVDRRLSESDFATQVGEMVGTPAYMSPEQAHSSGLDIDTRADIYSLGMVLYELITGVLPFDPRGLELVVFLVRHVLREKDHPTPSNRLASLAAEEVTPVAKRRQTTVVGLRKELTGDLDWIVLKAVEKDRARRYESAGGLAGDLQRYLKNQPVTARPPSTLYSLGKFVRRHRLAVAAGGVALVALVAVAVTMAALAGRIARERNRAELEGAKAQSINAFLADMLRSADPWQGGARQTTVVEALDAGARKVDSAFKGQPEIVTSIKRTIGNAYIGLGRVKDAEPLIRASVGAAIRSSGEESEETAQSLADLGNLYIALGRFDSAGPAIERALAIRRKLRGPDDTLVAATLTNLVQVMFDQADGRRMDSLATELLALQRRIHGERHLAVADALRRKAEAQATLGDHQKSESYLRPALRMARELGAAQTVYTASILNDLGLARLLQGDSREAQTIFNEAVVLDTVIYGTKHPQLAADLENLGNAYYVEGRFDITIGLLRQVLAMRQEMLTPDDPAIARTIANTATVHRKKGDFAAAEPLYQDAARRLRRALGPDHRDAIVTLSVLGRTQSLLGRRDQGEATMRDALARADRTGALSPEAYATLIGGLADVLIDQGRFAHAEPYALKALAIRDSLAGPNAGGNGMVKMSRDQLAKLYQGWGKPEKAASYRDAPLR
ncbi:MAG TPA: serine/threonine-protein kinase [Gemmatimonadales bacterium]